LGALKEQVGLGAVMFGNGGTKPGLVIGKAANIRAVG
jgi:hypothetical protein